MGILGSFFSYIARAFQMTSNSSNTTSNAGPGASASSPGGLNLKQPQKYKGHSAELTETVKHLLLEYQEIEDHRNFLVREVLWAKHSHTVQHEFVVIKCQVSYEEDGVRQMRHVNLQVERTANMAVEDVEDLKEAKVFPKDVLDHPAWSTRDWKDFKNRIRKEQRARSGGALGLSSSQAFSNGSQASVDSLGSLSPSKLLQSHPAFDLITRLPDGDTPLRDATRRSTVADHLATLSFSGQLPSLRDVLLAARVLSEMKPIYNLMMAHCYWFAQAFCNVLEVRFHNRCFLMRQPGFDAKAGRLHLIHGYFPVIPPQTHDIAAELQGLYQTLDNTIEDVEKDLNNSNRARNVQLAAKNIQVEAKIVQVEAEKAQVEAEKAQVEAEKAQVEAELEAEREDKAKVQVKMAALYARLAEMDKAAGKVSVQQID